MKKIGIKALLLSLLLVYPEAFCNAQQANAKATTASAPSIVVRGRADVTVTTPIIKLGDIADISSTRVKDDDAIIALQKIVLQSGLQAGKTVTLSANQILEELSSKGVNLSNIGYVLPRMVSVKRASRPISESEIKSVIEAALGMSGREVAIKKLAYPKDIQISPGAVSMQAIPLMTTQPGHIPFNVKVSAAGEDDISFEASANVDEWGEVPVARRPLNRGDVVGVDDVAMARMNIARLPRDVAEHQEGVVGYKVGQDLASGEVFRLDKLAVPPLVDAGSRVTLLYRSGLLEATASGIALESGILGRSIRVRNESSKKVITGTVTESGIVEVKQ